MEATKRMASGTLESTMMDALDDNEHWIQELNFCDSHVWYVQVAEAWEQIRGGDGVPRDMDAKAKEFMNALITYSGYCMDLGKGCELICISLSPESATRLAQAAAAVDFKAYRAAYYAKCDEHTKQGLGECSEAGSVERGFEDGFLPYVKWWVGAVNTAARKKRGLLVKMG
jgi:hypothetical protein